MFVPARNALACGSSEGLSRWATLRDLQVAGPLC
jgi:hypothetical protein